eukprot:NODE_2682_length_882_cov_70.642257_g2211_i0.p1 GENE.NODE_2682_length_882_cov_70.642257_g2211_i0~~NODE_2682_length_882_cov_70.642257_g2211_i0.p1  ORF type:complete len:137 (-),score=32.55 NODE_2682_length_882_cov_70.642257_g2211_i0:51-461(-)
MTMADNKEILGEPLKVLLDGSLASALMGKVKSQPRTLMCRGQGKSIDVLELLGMEEEANNEWMYTLQQIEGRDTMSGGFQLVLKELWRHPQNKGPLLDYLTQHPNHQAAQLAEKNFDQHGKYVTVCAHHPVRVCCN